MFGSVKPYMGRYLVYTVRRRSRAWAVFVVLLLLAHAIPEGVGNLSIERLCMQSTRCRTASSVAG